MATVAGTVTGCHLVQGSFGGDGRKTYHLVASFAVYTASSDSAAITTANTAIGSFTKNGKTVTLRSAIAGQAGKTEAGTLVYAAPTVTVNGTSLEFNLGGVTAEADCAACAGVGILVTVDES